jgi:hypothetical protein
MARLLLDENLPIRLGPLLVGHEVRTVRGRQWLGLSNGALLRAAQDEFDVFVTMDHSLPFQQAVKNLSIGVVILRAYRNTLPHLRSFLEPITDAAHKLPAGRVAELDLRHDPTSFSLLPSPPDADSPST